jgi:Ca-activated chloride channel homolog
MRTILNTIIAGLLVVFVLSSVTLGSAQIEKQVDAIEISQIDGSKFPSVTLYVRVLDANGKKVLGLTEDRIHILEDNKEVEILDFQSVNVSSIVTLMMIDVSGSMMHDNKMEAARDAANTFVDLMRKEDLVALWTFDHEVKMLVDFTSNQDTLKGQISRLYPNGGTAWYDAVIRGSKEIETQTGRRSLLLLTDGMDENSRNRFSTALKTAVDSQIPVYAIGLGSPGYLDGTELEKLANETGGEYYEIPSADELKQLYTSISQSTQEEYVITYKSPRASFDGTRRNIVIDIDGVSEQGLLVEQHLLHIESNFLVALITLLPLLALLAFPTLYSRFSMKRQPAESINLAPSPTVQPDYCSSCGQPLKPGARFCNVCGAQQQRIPEPPFPQPGYGNYPAQYGSYPPNQTPVAPPSAVPPAPQSHSPAPIYTQGHPQQPVNPPMGPPQQAQPNQSGVPKFCSQCGNQMRPGVRFCSRCGKQY